MTVELYDTDGELLNDPTNDYPKLTESNIKKVFNTGVVMRYDSDDGFIIRIHVSDEGKGSESEPLLARFRSDYVPEEGFNLNRKAVKKLITEQLDEQGIPKLDETTEFNDKRLDVIRTNRTLRPENMGQNQDSDFPLRIGAPGIESATRVFNHYVQTSPNNLDSIAIIDSDPDDSSDLEYDIEIFASKEYDDPKIIFADSGGSGAGGATGSAKENMSETGTAGKDATERGNKYPHDSEGQDHSQESDTSVAENMDSKSVKSTSTSPEHIGNDNLPDEDDMSVSSTRTQSKDIQRASDPDGAQTPPQPNDTEPNNTENSRSSHRSEVNRTDSDKQLSTQRTSRHRDDVSALTGNLEVFVGPEGSKQFESGSTHGASEYAQEDYDNDLDLLVIPEDGRVTAYFNAIRNGPEQFMAYFNTTADEPIALVKKFKRTLERRLVEEEGWQIIEDAESGQQIFNHMTDASVSELTDSGSETIEIDNGFEIEIGTVISEYLPVTLSTRNKLDAVRLFHLLQERSDDDLSVAICGGGRKEYLDDIDVVIQPYIAEEPNPIVDLAGKTRFDIFEQRVTEFSSKIQDNLTNLYESKSLAEIDSESRKQHTVSKALNYVLSDQEYITVSEPGERFRDRFYRGAIAAFVIVVLFSAVLLLNFISSSIIDAMTTAVSLPDLLFGASLPLPAASFPVWSLLTAGLISMIGLLIEFHSRKRPPKSVFPNVNTGTTHTSKQLNMDITQTVNLQLEQLESDYNEIPPERLDSDSFRGYLNDNLLGGVDAANIEFRDQSQYSSAKTREKLEGVVFGLIFGTIVAVSLYIVIATIQLNPRLIAIASAYVAVISWISIVVLVVAGIHFPAVSSDY